MEDKTLLHSFLKGNKDAFSFIFNKYIDELFAYGVSLGFERESIKDAIQDTFFKFYINKKQFDGIFQLKYYLFRMFKNRLLDMYRYTSNNNGQEINELPFLMETSVLDQLIDNEDKIILAKKVEGLLSLLTDRQKEAVFLRFIEEMDYEEIANLLEMTAPAVRKLISRAIKRIREKSS